MTILQIASDLHIEYKNDSIPNPLNYITPKADILILAGDIGSFYKINQLTKFMQELCKKFKVVLYVPGNHEWYMVPKQEPLSWNELEIRMRRLEDSITNLYILNRYSVRIGNLCIVGATLWSDPKCEIPPFIVRIYGVKTKQYKNFHEKDLKYLTDMIKYCNKNLLKLVVITHHPPTEKVLDNANKRKKFISLYATNLDYLLYKDKIDTWICGHTHKNFDFKTENGCRVVSNQKGKDKDHVDDYRKDFIINV